MKRIAQYTFAAVLVGVLSGPVLADSDAGPVAPAQLDAGSTAAADDPAEPAAAPDVLEAGREVLEAYKRLKDREAGASLRLLIAGLVGAIASLLIAALRRFPGIDKRKRWIPYALLGLGAIAGVADQLATGVGWAAALTALGPMLSVLFHQLAKQARPPKA